jgi:S-adenosylmethionine:tRNA ribosyltransferase-isomerase
MRTADFDYDLPRSMIAQRPAMPRESARLLEVRADGLIDRVIRDLPSLLERGDLLVFNDTKVVPTRIKGRRGAVRVEATLHRRIGQAIWRVFAKPGRRLRLGDEVEFDGGITAIVVEKLETGEVTLAFGMDDATLDATLERVGHMPLPPYIRREAPDNRDRDDYQTIFARRPGAVAAPTAGLHFTREILAALDARGVRRHAVTLHVGAGTFVPVKTQDPRDHRMHAEWGEISTETADAVNETRSAGGRIVAVGTTSLRLLEAASDDDGHVRPFRGDTDLYITPGFRFGVVDLLLTNFHLPRSTLLMLVSAFAGTKRVLAAYEHAKRTGYRFFSYGDACLLRRAS